MLKTHPHVLKARPLVLALLLSCCAPRPTGGTTPPESTAAPDRDVAGGEAAPEGREVTRPETVVEVWDASMSLLNAGPEPLFVAWSDGMIARRIDAGLVCGSVAPVQIEGLLRAVETAGFFDPPLEFGLVFPDGPMQVIRARSGGRERVLRHYGREDATLRQYLDEIGPDAFPTRQDAEGFVAMWGRVLEAIDAAAPSTSLVCDDSRPLSFPR
jgi:hypothetical protein